MNARILMIGLVVTTVAVPRLLAQDDSFRRVQRPGSVDLDSTYDLKDLTIPKEQIHTLLARDAIPALTDPQLEPVADVDWLADDARVIQVAVGDDVVGVPLSILDQHEIANLTVGDRPLAVTYCPLCDSAAVFSRRVNDSVLEFGVSGALFNSNVLMYDHRDKGLWSQLGMRAVSGPLSGTSLETVPVEVISLKKLKTSHPNAKVVSRNTGHQRDYSRSVYQRYFADDRLLVPVAEFGQALPRKTLGIGVSVGGKSWFIPTDAIETEYSLETPAGIVRIRKSEAGVEAVDVPEGVQTAQSFYYSWTAFYPDAEIARKK